jgi:hypothetical protein
VIDPVITAERRVKPDVSLVATSRLPDPRSPIGSLAH